MSEIKLRLPDELVNRLKDAAFVEGSCVAAVVERALVGVDLTEAMKASTETFDFFGAKFVLAAGLTTEQLATAIGCATDMANTIACEAAQTEDTENQCHVIGVLVRIAQACALEIEGRETYARYKRERSLQADQGSEEGQGHADSN